MLNNLTELRHLVREEYKGRMEWTINEIRTSGMFFGINMFPKKTLS